MISGKQINESKAEQTNGQVFPPKAQNLKNYRLI
jgi:hypothetical protein